MSSTLRIAVALVVVGSAVGVLSKTLHFGGPANLAALLVGMFLVSLVDQERFYGIPLFSRSRHPPRQQRSR